jgi:hypothetical protein
MSGLGETRQRRYDLFLHVASKSRERWYYGRPVRWRSLPERYVDEGDALHVHFAADAVAGEFCLSLHRWPCPKPLERFDIEALAGSPDGSATNREQRYGDPSMLVQVPKLVKNPEFVVRESVPSLAWLQSLDDCLCVGVEGTDAPAQLGGFGPARAVNGELGILGDSLGEGTVCIPPRQRVDELVERRPEVVDAFPDQDSPFRVGRRTRLKTQDVIAGVQVVFLGEGVRVSFQPPVEGCVQCLQLFTCPIELEAIARRVAGRVRQ